MSNFASASLVSSSKVSCVLTEFYISDSLSNSKLSALRMLFIYLFSDGSSKSTTFSESSNPSFSEPSPLIALYKLGVAEILI